MNRWTRTSAASLLAGATLLGGVAQAQSPLILDRNRPDRVQPVTPTTPQTKEAPSAAPAEVEGGAERTDTIIRGIQFIGTKAPASAARAAEPFIGQPATRQNLINVAKAVSDGYAKADVALYSVLIPEQDLSSGMLKILLIEGQVEQVIVTDKSGPRARKLITEIAAHLKGEQVLSKTRLQRYISLIQDVPGTKTDIQIVQGSRRGMVRIVLTITDKKHDFSTSFDNRASATYKGGQITANAKLYGLLRGGDQTDVTAAASINFKNFKYASIAHSTPIGSDGGRATASFGYLKTKPRRSVIEGEAQIAGLTYSFPLIRSYTRNLTLSGTIDGLNSDNAAFGQLISSERTRALRAAAGYVETKPKRTITGGITVSKGLDILGARAIEAFADKEFTKINARATIDQMIGKRMVARLRVSGQYTKDRLAAAERFAVGGDEFGRAFEIALLSGDRGAAGLAEIAYRPIKSGKFAGTEIYGFGDYSRITIVERGPIPQLFTDGIVRNVIFPSATYDLASAGGGARISYSTKAALFLEAARAIDRPYPGYDKQWRFNVGWRLSLRQ
ncbi:ShlB/FhaC/HecB family hemolysin secretion/activation protein [Sphingomonas montanisoli]|uniref:ShlB/FhaC/HecB family hemolysin secretion/activation protein n=1 Tax=Sphingomonas montanisoli TaxID=2606412 RepID=A0A5D9C062_9SPHN|nr:ShlB/FhaC/HecB family hemolysin secretion/activation protein [Sphingomonas montanisoli]TZG24652.1 ShlB/FhaC/HecB family hemolysin secretion/activation protein [Sphingomonas montanisoli]